MSADQKTEALTGHPTKLHNGAWGAHVNTDQVKVGDVVNLTTKAGKTRNARVERVVWTGADSDGHPCALCSLAGKDASIPSPPLTTTPPPSAAPATGADF